MRPKGLKTRIFLDGGNPEETKEIIDILGFLDGQTTNPTLIQRTPRQKNALWKAGSSVNRRYSAFTRMWSGPFHP